MRLLALETVTRAGSVAFCDGTACISKHGDPTRTHGVRLPDELLHLLEDARLKLSDVDAFVVVTGPGSFTGLRVGLATIQGLAFAEGRPVIGIPTLDALVSGWLEEHAPTENAVLACLDGARGDVFYALSDTSGAGHFDEARWLIEPAVDTPHAAAARIQRVLSGRPCAAVGDGIERYADVFHAAMPGMAIDVPPNLARAAALLASGRGTGGESPHALRPIYIRRPDAELARDRAASTLDFGISAAGNDADLADVAALQARVFGHGWGAEGLAGGEPNKQIAKVHVARERSGKLIGYSVVWLIVDELHIHSIAVDPGFQRKGIAKALLQRVLEEARSQGATSSTLEVRASNQPALALYQKLGFKTEAVRPAYYQNPAEDALILWRRKL